MIRLFLQAPFAAFRPFTAGSYRPTAGFLTPSAAYGLALNLAGEDTRRDDGFSAMTVTKFDLPPARIALGAVEPTDGERMGRSAFPSLQTIFQQLHNYPVGASGKERKADTKGSKYNIIPVRREFLSDIKAIVAIEFLGDPHIEAAIRAAVRGERPPHHQRYGLPFVGDNSFLIDKLQIDDKPRPAY